MTEEMNPSQRVYHSCKGVCSGYKQGYEDALMDVESAMMKRWPAWHMFGEVMKQFRDKMKEWK